ncbi:MAG: hypothetical protein ACK5NT_09575, partial [Pyrinomonadaceae bacterium]
MLPMLFVAFFCGVLLTAGCGNKKIEFRNLAPSETLAYFETNDLEASLAASIKNPAIKEIGANIDLSMVKGMRMAVFVTSISGTENEIGENSSILRVMPKFFAVLETDAWSWQVTSLVERTLDPFVRRTYGKNAKQIKTKRGNVDWYEWRAEDGRKVFATISGSVIVFGNDEKQIEIVPNAIINGTVGDEKIIAATDSLSDSL